MVVRINNTGPVKKKIPLNCQMRDSIERYTTSVKEVAPPQPIRIMANVQVAIAKLRSVMHKLEEIPHEAQGSRIGKSLSEIAYRREFRLEVQLIALVECQIGSALTFSNNSGEIVMAPADLIFRNSSR